MQILEPPSTTSYSDQDGHHIKTFLISTKPNEAGWQIAKETGHERVKTFIGKPSVIVPEELSDSRQKGHIHSNSRDTLLEEYKKHTHGIIESISSPYYYGDGTDDYFYMCNIKLTGSKAASALIESGEKTWIPFAVSPHIWANDSGVHSDWEGISLSLVPQGAYGKDAVVTKYCKGDSVSCNQSLGASLCDKEDSLAASMISSLLSESNNLNTMSTVQVTEQVPQVSNQPKEEKPDNSKLEELEALKKQLADEQKARQEKEETVTKLLNKDKTNTLNSIFKTVKDDNIRESLVQKYFDQDTDKLNDFAKDYSTHVVPSLIEEAKAQAEAELKQKVVEENKGKSKAASLPKEPEIPQESKAASTINEVKKFDMLMRGLQ